MRIGVDVGGTKVEAVVLDDAGAVVLRASDTPGILGHRLHADGSHAGILCVPGNVSRGAIIGAPSSSSTKPFGLIPHNHLSIRPGHSPI